MSWQINNKTDNSAYRSSSASCVWVFESDTNWQTFLRHKPTPELTRLSQSPVQTGGCVFVTRCLSSPRRPALQLLSSSSSSWSEQMKSPVSSSVVLLLVLLQLRMRTELDDWQTVCHSGCGSVTGDGWCSSTFHPGLLLLHVLQLFQQLPLLLPRQSDVRSRARPDTKHKVRQHVLFWRPRPVFRPTVSWQLSLTFSSSGDGRWWDPGRPQRPRSDASSSSLGSELAAAWKASYRVPAARRRDEQTWRVDRRAVNTANTANTC